MRKTRGAPRCGVAVPPARVLRGSNASRPVQMDGIAPRGGAPARQK
ncbi:hypothetical protein BURMUCGD1_1331 [Burkholderia multivorans CGD1]|nr:hypothetical protein BURMUCGD1_1331 [Burkholderia multivorans CGD1]